jgi:phosphodiesterase/alkaline phosphatase D-like protein
VAGEVRRHEGPEPMTLEEYPTRHALYKLDLQRWSASLPHVPGRFGAGSTHALRVLE